MHILDQQCIQHSPNQRLGGLIFYPFRGFHQNSPFILETQVNEELPKKHTHTHIHLPRQLNEVAKGLFNTLCNEDSKITQSLKQQFKGFYLYSNFTRFYQDMRFLFMHLFTLFHLFHQLARARLYLCCSSCLVCASFGKSISPYSSSASSNKHACLAKIRLC